MNLFAKGAALINRQMTAFASVRCEYRRGEVVILVDAGTGQTLEPIVESDGASLAARVVDWLVPAAQLKADGERFDPEPGHLLVTFDPEGVELHYEVSATPGGEKCWRYTREDRTRVRIHTRQIKVS